MDTEIEIKFFIAAKTGKRLPMVMAQHKVVDTSTKQLHNVYFDSADNTLRKLDFGLRVRTVDGTSVQTIKTKGRVLGGLHQRPEYNIGIDTARPELSSFPPDIWPDNFDVELLQSQLTPLFTTHFTRQAWLLSLDDDTLIEVAYDTGHVEGKYGCEVICELELEIVKGDVAQLFNLADEIATLGKVRLANVSKAQRGYRLAKEPEPVKTKSLPFVTIKPECTLETAFHDAILLGLLHWQYYEQLFCEAPSIDLAKQLLQGVQLIHQAMLHYSAIAPELLQSPWLSDLVWLENQLSGLEHRILLRRCLKNKGHYLRKLPNQKQLITIFTGQLKQLGDLVDIKKLLHSQRYAQLIVAITRSIYSRSWQLDKTSRLQLSGALRPFAVSTLNNSWEKLISLLPEHSSAESLLAIKGNLQRNLLLGLCIGDCFDAQSCAEFRSPWLDIIHGVEDLQLLALVAEQVEQMSAEEKIAFKRWQKRKTSSLIEAVNFSLEQAIQMQPYWQ